MAPNKISSNTNIEQALVEHDRVRNLSRCSSCEGENAEKGNKKKENENLYYFPIEIDNDENSLRTRRNIYCVSATKIVLALSFDAVL